MKKSRRGFTLVELIISMAIFSLMTTLVIANFRSASSQRLLRSQANALASVFKQAQVQALSGKPFNSAVPVGGYGVLLSICSVPPCAVTLFADVNGDFTYDGAAEKIEDFALGQNVTLTALSLAAPVAVVYKPPSAFVCINGKCSETAPVQITLTAYQTASSQIVKLNPSSGQISS